VLTADDRIKSLGLRATANSLAARGVNLSVRDTIFKKLKEEKIIEDG